MYPRYLEAIIEAKRKAIEGLEATFDHRLMRQEQVPSLKQALQKEGLSIIGEIKKASPSKGIIKQDFDPYQIASIYEHTVDAMSILTEETYFKGSAKYIQEISKNTQLPILQKDFIMEKIQVYYARHIGASAILLIVGILTDEKLKSLFELAYSMDLEVLVEVHNLEEVKRIEGLPVQIVGINNRNLKDFTVDLKTTEKLRAYLPQDICVVSESGIHTPLDIKKLSTCGIDGVLVGESLMRTDNIRAHVEVLRDAF